MSVWKCASVKGKILAQVVSQLEGRIPGPLWWQVRNTVAKPAEQLGEQICGPTATLPEKYWR